MCEKNVLKGTASLFDEFLEDDVIIGWVNNVAFLVWLHIVGEDSKIVNLELSNINSFLLLFWNYSHFGVHF